jgi:hypothetical protein
MIPTSFGLGLSPPLSSVLGVSRQAGKPTRRGLQNHHKHIFASSPCPKLFAKKSTKNPMCVLPGFCVLSRFGAFLGKGVESTISFSKRPK